MRNSSELNISLLSSFYACDALGEDTDNEEVLQVLGEIQVATQNGIIALINNQLEAAEAIDKSARAFISRIEAVMKLEKDIAEYTQLN